MARYSATVTAGGTTRATVVSSGSTTQVKKVVVGTPIRRVSGGSGNINNITGINTQGAVHGSLLVYSSISGVWEASLDLEEQNINGGSY
jgi:hypothetical protein